MTAGPYKGLAPFEDSDFDALLFFGRERESEIVAANVVASRLTILYGPSGVGKSSLLRAAVAYVHEVKTGAFGTRMQVELVNDGPVTIVLDTP